jgi:hypothetical protein
MFYARQSPGLDDYFLDCLQSDLKLLESTAGIHEKYYGLYRTLSSRFPFAIYYLFKDDLIDVVAILDCRQDPEKTDARIIRTIVL